jgi:serine/threonine protein kinase
LLQLNVLVTHSGRAVLADFGLSSVVTDSKIHVFSASTLKTGGTVRWQAPELFSESRNSLASDVYAFACVCYEVRSNVHSIREPFLYIHVILDIHGNHSISRTHRCRSHVSRHEWHAPDEILQYLGFCLDSHDGMLEGRAPGTSFCRKDCFQTPRSPDRGYTQRCNF